ncbi:MAG: dockerin type I domain-containing protein, partial [Candidatus Poribacteria bacterium]|nr:dockerin type I domain-containing protein [Candidatus Poribacteria bacterium]
PDFLIVGNTNYLIFHLTGAHMNVAYLEGAAGGGPDDWRQARNSLQWLETNLREPRTVMLQGGTDIHEPPDSPYNLRLMRATTTMSLTHSDGYVQFPIGTSDEKYWYDFWDADLGRPVGEKFQFYEEIEGLYIREFTNGWAVYNHSGEAQVITLPEEVQGVASSWVGTEHVLPNLDGEMYLRKTVVSDQSPVTSKNPADVNGDGAVNILDLTLVAQGFGTNKTDADVNGDGVVNVFDLVFVAREMQ